MPPEQLHHLSRSVQGKVGVRHVRSLRKSSFNFRFFVAFRSALLSAFRNTCLDDAAAVNDKEGVVGEVGGGVQNSKDARDLSVCLKV